jgi:serine/threonine protein kinase
MATHEVSVEEVAFGEVLGPSPKPGPSATASPVAYRYTYLQYLGRGGYGLTYVVRRTSDEAKLVVKILSLGSSHGPKPAGAGNGHPGANANHNGAPKSALTTLEHSSMAKVTQEVTNLTRISKHFGVTQLVEGIVVDRHALLFMEFCDAGDLHREISRMRRRGTAFPEDTVKIVLLQLVFALHHLHRTGMMHRDVKASNVLLCTSGLVKLGDFGLSKTVEVASTFCGTPTHLAPEVWEKNTYGKKADIWSLGVVLYHILALRVPFTSRQYDQLRKQVCREEYPRLSAMKLHYTPELVSLCERLMTRDVDTRPDAATILRDPLMLAMIDRWPDLIRNSPSVRPALRDRILECLVEDEVLGIDYGGALRCAPNLRRTPQQLRSSSSNKAERTTPGSTSGSGTPGSAVTTATSAAPQRSPETALSPSQAVAADGSAQPQQPGEECASPPGSPAEEGEKFVISPDALQDEARRADDATSRVANGTDDEPLASGVLAREAVPPEAAAPGAGRRPARRPPRAQLAPLQHGATTVRHGGGCGRERRGLRRAAQRTGVEGQVLEAAGRDDSDPLGPARPRADAARARGLLRRSEPRGAAGLRQRGHGGVLDHRRRVRAEPAAHEPGAHPRLRGPRRGGGAAREPRHPAVPRRLRPAARAVRAAPGAPRAEGRQAVRHRHLREGGARRLAERDAHRVVAGGAPPSGKGRAGAVRRLRAPQCQSRERTRHGQPSDGCSSSARRPAGELS